MKNYFLCHILYCYLSNWRVVLYGLTKNSWLGAGYLGLKFELWASAFAPHLVALYPVPRTMHQCFIVQLMIRGGVRVRACSQWHNSMSERSCIFLRWYLEGLEVRRDGALGIGQCVFCCGTASHRNPKPKHLLSCFPLALPPWISVQGASISLVKKKKKELVFDYQNFFNPSPLVISPTHRPILLSRQVSCVDWTVLHKLLNGVPCRPCMCFI